MSKISVGQKLQRVWARWEEKQCGVRRSLLWTSDDAKPARASTDLNAVGLFVGPEIDFVIRLDRSTANAIRAGGDSSSSQSSFTTVLLGTQASATHFCCLNA